MLTNSVLWAEYVPVLIWEEALEDWGTDTESVKMSTSYPFSHSPLYVQGKQQKHMGYEGERTSFQPDVIKNSCFELWLMFFNKQI